MTQEQLDATSDDRGGEYAALRERLVQAKATLVREAQGVVHHGGSGSVDREVRLRAKADGVALALSYLDEMFSDPSGNASTPASEPRQRKVARRRR